MPVHNHFTFQTARSSPGPTPLPQPSPVGLQLSGPVVAVQVEIPAALASQLQQANQVPPNPVAGLALIDTGATISAVDAAVVQQLGVQPVGVTSVGTAGGPHQQALYPARFVFPGTPIPPIEFSQLLGANLVGQAVAGQQGPLIALLGRDILRHFVLVYNGPAGMFTLAF